MCCGCCKTHGRYMTTTVSPHSRLGADIFTHLHRPLFFYATQLCSHAVPRSARNAYSASMASQLSYEMPEVDSADHTTISCSDRVEQPLPCLHFNRLSSCIRAQEEERLR